MTFTAASQASPTDNFNCLFTITTAGALGVAQFTYSLDGGITTAGPVVTTASTGIFAVPNAGIVVTFSGVAVAGDYFTFATSGFNFVLADLVSAWNVVINDPRTWGLCHIVGQMTPSPGSSPTAAQAAINFAAVEAMFVTMNTTQYRYARFFMDCPYDTVTNIVAACLSAFAGSAGTHGCVSPSPSGYMTSCINTRVLPRSASWHAAARASQVPISQDLGRVATGPLKQIPGASPRRSRWGLPQSPSSDDEQVSGGLDAGRFLTLRSIIGQAGFFITNPNIMCPIWLRLISGSSMAGSSMSPAPRCAPPRSRS